MGEKNSARSTAVFRILETEQRCARVAFQPFEDLQFTERVYGDHRKFYAFPASTFLLELFVFEVKLKKYTITKFFSVSFLADDSEVEK